MYLEIMVLIALILLVITIVLEVFLLVKNKPMNTLSKFDLDDIKKVVNDTTNEKLENQTGAYIEIDVVGKCKTNEWLGNISPQIFIEQYEITGEGKYLF